MRLGRWEIASVVDARFAADGGTVFGVVPRVLWERHAPPDARNRVPLAARCLVAVDADARRVVLVDCGFGDAPREGWAERYALDRSAGGLEAGLARLGLSRADVTDLLLTHLHLDHAGGIIRRGADGAPALAFPHAVHHVQHRAWQHARSGSERDAPSFQAADLELLAHSSQLHLVDGEAQLFPDAELVVSEGHTPGQQLPRFHDDRTHLTFCGDVIPTHLHLRPRWGLAHDLLPVTAVEEKKVLVADAVEDGGVLAFAHDPDMAACRLGEEDGRPVFREAVVI